jgi:hypothetical protein
MSHNAKIGDILVASWGYDATWQDFYEVIAVTPTQAKVRKLKKEFVMASSNDRSLVRPLPGEYLDDDVLTRKIKYYTADTYYIKVREYALATSGTYEIGKTYAESIYC